MVGGMSTATNPVDLPSQAERFRSALAAVATRLPPDDARSLRSYANRFHAHCVAGQIDPLAPGCAAWEDFVESRKDRPYPEPFVGPEGEGADKQRMLEERYLSAASLGKYKDA